MPLMLLTALAIKWPHPAVSSSRTCPFGSRK